MTSLPLSHPLSQVPGLWHPQAPRRGAVVLFRQEFSLRRRQALAVEISASHRYELRLDGIRLARGPSRSDSRRWGVRRVGLGRLAAGVHVLAVVVAHDGDDAGESQVGPDGFLAIAGVGPAAGLITQEAWRTFHDRACTPCREDGWGEAKRYSPVGSGERFAAALHPWGWERPGHRGKGWVAPLALRQAADVWGNLGLGCQLAEESIPPMAEGPLPWKRCALAPAGVDAAAWASGKADLRLAPRSRVRLVLDRAASGVHWPTLAWEGGCAAEIRLTWCEAPQDEARRLGARDVVAGKSLPGHRDLVLPDGGRGRVWTPRWLRSGRYLVLDITVRDQALTLHPVLLSEAGFPFRRRLRVEADAAWRRLVDISDRTLRSCAHECIWDCPHYEQCQFPGDARVQSIAHYLLYGDDRLARKALSDFADSQRPDGLLLCRAPARSPQRIDTFTLQWLLMLGEFLRWRGDAAFVAGLLPSARKAMTAFLERRRDDGLIGGGLMAPFVDWSPSFTAGNAPEDADGGSSIIALLAAQACRALAGLEEAAGWSELAPRWRSEAEALRRAVRRSCVADGVLWDTPSRRSRSVHAQVEAIHAGLLSGRSGEAALRRAIGNPDAAQVGTRYYTWHLAEAWHALGRPRQALALLGGWRAQLGRIAGLATWPESDGSPRSDCHGWGAYPVLAWAGVLLGARPAAAGCTAVALDPCLEGLDAAAGEMLLPQGRLRVELSRSDAGTRVAWDSPVPLLVGGRRQRAGRGSVLI